MKIKATSAIAMFIALGFKTADKWSATRLESKLKTVSKNVEEGTELDDADANATLQSVIEANNAGTEITVEDDNEATAKPAKKKAAAKGKSAPKKKAAAKSKSTDEATAKPAKKKAAAKAKADKPAKAGAEKDKFGTRVGTQAANINAVMTKKVQTDAEIAEASGYNLGRVRGHLKWGIENGHFEKTDKGYKLV